VCVGDAAKPGGHPACTEPGLSARAGRVTWHAPVGPGPQPGGATAVGQIHEELHNPPAGHHRLTW